MIHILKDCDNRGPIHARGIVGGAGKVHQLVGDETQGEQWVVHHLLLPGLYIGYMN